LNDYIHINSNKLVFIEDCLAGTYIIVF